MDARLYVTSLMVLLMTSIGSTVRAERDGSDFAVVPVTVHVQSFTELRVQANQIGPTNASSIAGVFQVLVSTNTPVQLVTTTAGDSLTGGATVQTSFDQSNIPVGSNQTVQMTVSVTGNANRTYTLSATGSDSGVTVQQRTGGGAGSVRQVIITVQSSAG